MVLQLPLQTLRLREYGSVRCAVLIYRFNLFGTIIGGLSPQRIRSDPPTSPPERPPRRTQADPKKVRLSPPRIRSDPIGSAINWRTVRQKKSTTASAGKRVI